MEIELNEITARLPKHLWQFINVQNYEQYSSIDQAVWRHVMTKNIEYLPSVAHHSYLEGLKKTGISIQQIPSMYGMNRILKEIGWAAVAVDGFIPPSAFMEFQAYKVLVIAQDIRLVENISYTPAPDILHEAAGHAPIIANPEYSEYLRRFGEIGCRAISSAKDHELYEAIRYLSILKESNTENYSEIKKAEEAVVFLQNNMGEPSEMAKIRNLHWWTVEYGLIGTLENSKIYGAGLLSSIGESQSCLKPNVKKIFYDIQAADKEFDITKPQPQLFVTPDFAHLSFVLEQFANNMALRKGGSQGIEKLIESGKLGTIEYNTGIQISGVFHRLIKDDFHRPIYIQTRGSTALSYHEKELIGHGITTHAYGFGSPVGKLKNSNSAIENMSPFDLDAYKIREGNFISLDFEGGLTVEGEVITGVRSLNGKIILISFKNCTVKYSEEILFKPEWGVYDMAVGSEIVSAFAGPADIHSFEPEIVVSQSKTIKSKKNHDMVLLESLYSEVREMRETEKINKIRLLELGNILDTRYPGDWLLKSEIEEMVKNV
jgi:phenylalanine-4-hydroxylase